MKLRSTIAAIAMSFAGAAAAAPQCPCTIWPTTAVPKVAADVDAASVNLGVEFISDVDGYVKGIRFYKGAKNTGKHVGSLWSSDGRLLARAAFSSETRKGWQSVTFAQPVAITAGTSYTASYLAPRGRYAVDQNYFARAFSSPPLMAIAGVYRYGASSAFPVDEWQASNYWVDVSFVAAAAPPPETTAVLEWTASESPEVTGYRVYYGTTSGSYDQPAGSGIAAGASTSYTVIGLTSGVTYFFAVTSTDDAGNESGYSNEAAKALH